MTISDAQKICKDFQPSTRTGKVRCIHIQDSSLATCWKESHFLCELLIKKELGVKDESMGKDGAKRE